MATLVYTVHDMSDTPRLQVGVLLDAIRKRSINAYSEEDVQSLFAPVGVKCEALASKFKHQLYEYF